MGDDTELAKAEALAKERSELERQDRARQDEVRHQALCALVAKSWTAADLASSRVVYDALYSLANHARGAGVDPAALHRLHREIQRADFHDGRSWSTIDPVRALEGIDPGAKSAVAELATVR